MLENCSLPPFSSGALSVDVEPKESWILLAAEWFLEANDCSKMSRAGQVGSAVIGSRNDHSRHILTKALENVRSELGVVKRGIGVEILDNDVVAEPVRKQIECGI